MSYCGGSCDSSSGMGTVGLLLLLASLVVLDFAGVVGVQITHLRVPQAVRNNSFFPAVLDCDYSLRPGEEGLVVKWFFNNGPAPVYQWIPGQKPQDLGILKGRLNVSYEASDNHATKYRALYIINPTTDLSGEYKCFVSTFNDEDFMIKKMVIFASGRNFELTHSRSGVDSVNISCKAEGLFPEPKMVLFKDPDRKDKTGMEGVVVETASKEGVYDIKATKIIEYDDLQSTTMFDCELRIPEANYVVRKSIVYYPGLTEDSSDSGVSFQSRERLFITSWLSVACLTFSWRLIC